MEGCHAGSLLKERNVWIALLFPHEVKGNAVTLCMLFEEIFLTAK